MGEPLQPGMGLGHIPAAPVMEVMVSFMIPDPIVLWHTRRFLQ